MPETQLHLLQGMQGSIDKAEEVVARTEGAFMLQQFESAANPEVHYKTTGPEIWRDTAGTVDFLVAGVVTPAHVTHVLSMHEHQCSFRPIF